MPRTLTPEEIGTIRFHLQRGVRRGMVAGWFGIRVIDMLDALEAADKPAQPVVDRPATPPAPVALAAPPPPRAKPRARQLPAALPPTRIKPTAARQSTPTDFERQVTEQSLKLAGLARKLTRDNAAAEDLISETVLKALEKRDQFRDGTNVGAWMATIMRNMRINEHRSAGSRKRTDVEDLEIHMPAQPPSQHVTVELREALRALGDLPEHMRRVIDLVRVEGCSYEEAAQREGVNIGTVKSRLSRATERLEAACS